MVTASMTVEIRTGAARLWLYACVPLFAVSPTIARRVAIFGVHRLARYRIAGAKKWIRLPREMLDTMIEVSTGR